MSILDYISPHAPVQTAAVIVVGLLIALIVLIINMRYP